MGTCVGLVLPMCEWHFSWCRSRFLQIFMRGTRLYVSSFASCQSSISIPSTHSFWSPPTGTASFQHWRPITFVFNASHSFKLFTIALSYVTNEINYDPSRCRPRPLEPS
jgi:hypothetical protein